MNKKTIALFLLFSHASLMPSYQLPSSEKSVWERVVDGFDSVLTKEPLCNDDNRELFRWFYAPRDNMLTLHEFAAVKSESIYLEEIAAEFAPKITRLAFEGSHRFYQVFLADLLRGQEALIFGGGSQEDCCQKSHQLFERNNMAEFSDLYSWRDNQHALYTQGQIDREEFCAKLWDKQKEVLAAIVERGNAPYASLALGNALLERGLEEFCDDALNISDVIKGHTLLAKTGEEGLAQAYARLFVFWEAGLACEESVNGYLTLLESDLCTQENTLDRDDRIADYFIKAVAGPLDPEGQEQLFGWFKSYRVVDEAAQKRFVAALERRTQFSDPDALFAKAFYYLMMGGSESESLAAMLFAQADGCQNKNRDKALFLTETISQTGLFTALNRTKMSFMRLLDY